MKRILSLLLIITVLACGMINAAAETPSVYIEGIENGQTIEYGTEVAAIVSAASSYNKITLFLNGEEAASAESATERFVLSDVPSGRNVLKAVAEGDYGKAVSEEVEFYYLVMNEETLANDDFEDEATRQTNWYFESQTPRAVYEEVDGDYSLVTYHQTGMDGAMPKLKAQSALLSKLPASEFTLEFDTKQIMWHATTPKVQCKMFMYVDGTSNYIGGMPRETYTGWTPALTLGTNGEPYQKMTSGVWYHVKYVIDISKGNISMYWAEGKKNDADMQSLGTHTFKSGSKITRFDMEFDGYGAQMPCIMIDNILIRESKASPYLTAPSFEHYGVAADSGKIPANPTKISIPFSVAMNKDTLSDDAFKFTSEGKDVDVATISYDEDANEVVVIPKKQLTANKPYKLTVAEGAKTSVGMEVPTELVYSFDTPLNDFDIARFAAISNGGEASLADISAGDSVSFECMLQNKTDKLIEEGVLIFVVYENGTLAYLDAQPISVNANCDIAPFASTKEYVSKAKPDSVEVYVWKSMTERISLAPAQSLK